MAETDANKPKKKKDKVKPAEPKTVAEAKKLEETNTYWQLTDDEVLLRSPEPDDDYKTSDSWRVFRILGEFVSGFDNMATITRGVSVFGSARTHQDDPNYSAAMETGKLLAEAGFEVITGGASATYGSDAVSGVLNFKLRRDLEGLQLDAKAGITERGDAGNRDITASWGGRFADGRGRAIFSLGFHDRDLVRAVSRDFFRQSNGIGYSTWADAHALGSFVGRRSSLSTVGRGRSPGLCDERDHPGTAVRAGG
jgi:hypothetical protein